MNVTIFSKPNCIQCKMSKSWFKGNNIDVVEIDITLDENYLYQMEIMSLGFRTVPVVKIGEEYVNGFAPNKFKEILKIN